MGKAEERGWMDRIELCEEKMIKKDIDTTLIADCTGLAIKEINKLKDETTL